MPGKNAGQRIPEQEQARVKCERLDPVRVHIVPAYRLRLPQSFADTDFTALKASLAHTGGNVQPIKVRSRADGQHDLVFGSRRLQALRELGLPVLAVSAEPSELSDPDLVVELVASNAGGRVSLLELGGLFTRALRAGLFPSRRRLAERVGQPLTIVSLAVDLAELPLQLFASMQDPRMITPSQARKLLAASRQDPAGFGERLAEASKARPASAREALAHVLGKSPGSQASAI